jgi:hypothetical protein
VTTTAQIATITLTGVAGTSSAGPVSTVAQIATMTISGLAGVSSVGPVTTTAQIATLTLTALAGVSTAGAAETVAQVATMTLTGLAGVSSAGPVTTVAQVATLTITGLSGVSSAGPVTTTAQVATMTLTAIAAPSSVATLGSTELTDRQNPTALGMWVLRQQPVVTTSLQHADGDLEDPGTVKFLVRNPDRFEMTYTYGVSGFVTRIETGVFTLEMPQLTIAGDWYVRANGGGSVPQSFEAPLTVRPSLFTTPLP